MKTKRSAFEQLVYNVLGAFIDPLPHMFSDDMDDWLASTGDTTYTERHMEMINERLKSQEKARTDLMQASPEALPAVRKGLRHTKYARGREVLLEFMKQHGGEEADKEVLRLLAVRQRDPLSRKARDLLEEWGDNIDGLFPKPRSTPTPTEIEFEQKLARLVEKCRQPTKVQDMMKDIRISNRRHFTHHYLSELVYHRGFVEVCAYRGPLRNCYRITAKGIAWLEQRAKQKTSIAGSIG
jgi:hypothetical protein